MNTQTNVLNSNMVGNLLKPLTKDSCANCGETNWAAKNDRYCTSCEHAYCKAFKRATHISTVTGIAYMLNHGTYAYKIVDSIWRMSSTTNRQVEFNSNFKEVNL